MTAVNEFVGRYRAAGWKSVPVHRPGAEPGTCSCGDAKCAKPGKHPDSRHWPGGSADAAHFEGRNVGVFLGPDSNNLADVYLDCTEALLAAPHLLLPTPAAFGRGSAVTHHLYTVADGAATFAQLRDPVRAGANATIVELRWPDWDKAKERPKAVQTVFPPSLHYRGKEVAWVREGAPAAVPGADLVAAVRRVGAAVLVGRYAKPKVRHDLVLLLANLGVRAGWADDATVVSFIAAVFAAMKDTDKLEKILRGEGPNAVGDARKRLRDGKPMTGLPALAKMLDPALGAAEAEAVVTRVRDWLGLPDRDPPKPAAGAAGLRPGGARPAAPAAPIPPYAPFPTHLLPPAVRDYVAATAAAINCDPAYSALPALAALGAAIGGSHAASPKKRWKEPPYIWAVAIGRSGATKSPPYRDVEDLAEDINDRLDREYKLAAATYDAEFEAWQEAKRAGDDPGPRPQAPVRRAFLKGDVTIEALVGALKDNPRGLLIGQDELAAWIGSFVKYAGKAGSTDLPRWLQLHHAGTVNYTRKTGDPDTRVVRVRGVGLSVTGTIQPGILARVLTDEFRASGFLARLLIALPAWRKRLWTEAEVDEPTRAAFAGLLDALHALPAGAWPDGKPCPHLVRLSAGAKAAFVAFYDANGAALETADDEMGAVMSKLEGYALRFALIFHCCRLREYAKDSPVTADNMAAAIELTAWFRAEAERVYQALAEPAELRTAREVARAGGREARRAGDGPPAPAVEPEEVPHRRRGGGGAGRPGGGRAGVVGDCARRPEGRTRGTGVRPAGGSGSGRGGRPGRRRHGSRGRRPV